MGPNGCSNVGTKLEQEQININHSWLY